LKIVKMSKYYRDTETGRVPFTPAQEAQRDAEIADWESKATERKSKEIRSERDALIAQTDWMALSDVTLAPEWVTYRQALRDVPQQEGFPENVTWPPEPTTPKL
jgi:hypothetical protein